MQTTLRTRLDKTLVTYKSYSVFLQAEEEHSARLILPPLFRKTVPFCQYLSTIQAKQYIFIDIMGKKSVILLPKTGKILEQMGEQIRLARMRRKISVALAAERAGVSRASV